MLLGQLAAGGSQPAGERLLALRVPGTKPALQLLDRAAVNENREGLGVLLQHRHRPLDINL